MVLVKALAVFLGTIIGVGIFGLPFAAAKAGFGITAGYIFLMAAIAIIIHIFYAEVAMSVEGKDRLPGYAKKYLGPFWEKVCMAVVISILFGALLPYLIVGGEFLNFFLSPYFGENLILCTLLFFSGGAYIVFKELKNISRAELVLLVLILLIPVILFIKSAQFIELGNFLKFNPKFLFFPYGIALFSLWASDIVPELKDLLAQRDVKKVSLNLKSVIVLGISFTAFIYIFFIFTVLGVSGDATSSEAISGLSPFLSSFFVKLGYIFGMICCFSSFITIALALKRTLWYDFGLSENISWFLTCFLPLLIFLLGARSFLPVIGFIGSVAIGIEAIIIVFLYKGMVQKRFKRGINPSAYLLVLVFFIGILFEILKIIS